MPENGNKKVLNATPLEYDGIQFKSKLEVETYKALKEEGFDPEYEKHSYVLQETKHYSTPCYTPYVDRKLHMRVWGLNKYKILGLRYTPDFVFKIADYQIFIEVKGFQNERYPYQKKLFLKMLEDSDSDNVFFEIHTKAQLGKALEILRNLKQERHE